MFVIFVASKISVQDLEDLRLMYERPERLRDEVFADLYAHSTGITSSNVRSQRIRELFPKTLEYIENQRLSR